MIGSIFLWIYMEEYMKKSLYLSALLALSFLAVNASQTDSSHILASTGIHSSSKLMTVAKVTVDFRNIKHAAQPDVRMPA